MTTYLWGRWTHHKANARAELGTRLIGQHGGTAVDLGNADDHDPWTQLPARLYQMLDRRADATMDLINALGGGGGWLARWGW